MKTVRYILALALLAMFSLSCKEKEDPAVTAAKEYLSAKQYPGVYSEQGTEFFYSEADHQLAWNPSLQLTRIQTDNMSKVLQLTVVGEMSDGAKVELKTYSKNVSGLESSYEVKVLKTDPEQQLAWLFNQTSLLGFVVCYQ